MELWPDGEPWLGPLRSPAGAGGAAAAAKGPAAAAAVTAAAAGAAPAGAPGGGGREGEEGAAGGLSGPETPPERAAGGSFSFAVSDSDGEVSLQDLVLQASPLGATRASGAGPAAEAGEPEAGRRLFAGPESPPAAAAAPREVAPSPTIRTPEDGSGVQGSPGARFESWEDLLVSPEVLGYDSNLAVIEQLAAERAGEMEGLAGEIEDFRSRSHQLQSKLDEHGVERAQLQHRLDEAEALQHETAAELEILEAAAGGLRAQLSEAQALAAAERERADDAEQLQRNYLASLQESAAKASHLESELESLTSLAAAADAVASSQAENMIEATDQLTVFAENLENANSRAEGLEAEICLLESKLADAEGAVLHHRQGLVNVGDRLEELEEEKRDAEKRADALQEEVDAERRRALGLEIQLEELQAVAGQLQQELEEAHAAAAAEAERAQENCRNLEKHTEQLGSMQSVIHFLEREGKYLRKQIAALKTEGDSRDEEALRRRTSSDDSALEQDVAVLLLERDSYEVQLENAMDLAEKHEDDQAALSRKYDDSLQTIESQQRRIESLVSRMGELMSAEEEVSRSDPGLGAASAQALRAEVHALQEQLHRAALAALESEAEIALAEGSSQEVRKKMHRLRQKLTEVIGIQEVGHLDAAELGDAVAEYITTLEIRLSAARPACGGALEDAAAQCDMPPPAAVVAADVSACTPREGDTGPQVAPSSARKRAQTAAGSSQESATQYDVWEFAVDARTGPEPSDSSLDGGGVFDAAPQAVTAASVGLLMDRAEVPCAQVPSTDEAPSAAVTTSMVSLPTSASVATQADIGASVSLADASTTTVDAVAVVVEDGSSFLSDATAVGLASPPRVVADLGFRSPHHPAVEFSLQQKEDDIVEALEPSLSTADASCDAADFEAPASRIGVQTVEERTGVRSDDEDRALAMVDFATLRHTPGSVGYASLESHSPAALAPGSAGYASVDSRSLAALTPRATSPVSHMETQTPPGRNPPSHRDFDWKAKATELEAALHEAQETLAEQMGAAARILESRGLCNEPSYGPLNDSSGASETELYETQNGDGFEEGGMMPAKEAEIDSTQLTEIVTVADAACATEVCGLVMPEPVPGVDAGSDAVVFEGPKMTETGSDAAAFEGPEMAHTGSDAVAFGGPAKTDSGCCTDFFHIPDIVMMSTHATQTRTEMGDTGTQTRVHVGVQGSQTRTEVGVCATQTLVEVSHAASATEEKVASHVGVQAYTEIVGVLAADIEEIGEPAAEDIFIEEASDSESSVCSIPDFKDPPRASQAQTFTEGKAASPLNLEPLAHSVVADPQDAAPVVQHYGGQRSGASSRGTSAALFAPTPPSKVYWDEMQEVDTCMPQPWTPWLSRELPAHQLTEHEGRVPGGPLPPMDPCLARSQLLVRSAELERLKAESTHRQCLQASKLRAPLSVQTFMDEIRSVMIA